MTIGDTISDRPWGNWMKLYQESGVWVKRVLVEPDNRLSLQKHAHRTEKWVVVKGEGLAIVNDDQFKLIPGKIIDIPVGAVHRMCNTGQEKLIVIEVATGDELTEEDIVRIQDDYER